MSSLLCRGCMEELRYSWSWQSQRLGMLSSAAQGACPQKGLSAGWDMGEGQWFLNFILFLNINHSDFPCHCLEFPSGSKGMGLCCSTKQANSHIHTRPNPFSSGKTLCFVCHLLTGEGAFFGIASWLFAIHWKSIPVLFCKITVPTPSDGLGDKTQN